MGRVKKKETEGRWHPSTPNDAQTAPISLLGRTSAPHGARCTAAGFGVTHDAMLLPAGWRQQRGGGKYVCA